MCKCTPSIRTPWCGKPGCEISPVSTENIPCTKCAVVHPDKMDCEYNLTYQYWLLRQLEKVNHSINSRLN